MLPQCFRRGNAAAGIVLFALPWRAAAEEPRSASPPTPPPPPATVVCARDDRVVHLFKVDATRAARLVNAAVTRLAGEQDAAAAWRHFVSPGDRVGIKISTAPGPVMSTRREVVDAVIDGLRAAGVSPSRILVFDRYEAHMRAAGYPFGRREDGVTFTATLPERGYDPDVAVDLVLPGKLIWGDSEFRKESPAETDQVSTLSHFSRILTQDIDRFINVAPLRSDANFGLYGCRLNASLGFVDNFRRLQRASLVREDSLVDLFRADLLQKKGVLHLLDGLIGQFAGGPAFDPSVCWPHQTIYAGRDPIALDCLGLHAINRQRPAAKILPAEIEAPYLGAAAAAGLGVADLARIPLIEVTLDR